MVLVCPCRTIKNVKVAQQIKFLGPGTSDVSLAKEIMHDHEMACEVNFSFLYFPRRG